MRCPPTRPPYPAEFHRQTIEPARVLGVSEAVVYMAGLPLSAIVLSMTVMASGMPYVGRG